MSKRDSFLLRLPPEMLESLRRWAEDELRSTNSQIEVLLLKALKEAGRQPKGKDESENKWIGFVWASFLLLRKKLSFRSLSSLKFSNLYP